MSYHPTTKQITDLLAERHVPFRTFEHAPVRTSEEAASLRPEFSMHQGAKTLIVRARDKNNGIFFAMLVFPADLKFDSKKAKSAIGAKSISFATEEEVARVTHGVQIGGVPPFGNLFGLPVYVDESLFENEEIIFNAGDRSFSVAMKSADYRNLVQPIVSHLVANPE
jgi:Ala-tRNA(Pro) deacylase